VTAGPNISTWRGLAILAAIALCSSALVGLIAAIIISATTHGSAVRQGPP